MSRKKLQWPFNQRSAPLRSLLGDGFLVACMKDDISKVRACVAKNPEVLDKADDHGLTPLMWAAANGCGEVVRYLVSNGANVNAESLEGYTPLMAVAAHGKNPEDLYVLIKAGAEINRQNKNGWTALMEAVKYGHVDMAIFMVRTCKADLNLKNLKEETVLDVAGASGNNAGFFNFVEFHLDLQRQNAIYLDTQEMFGGIVKDIPTGGRMSLRPPQP